MVSLNRIIRYIFTTLIVVCIGIPAVVYLLLSLPYVQNKVRRTAEKELSHLVALPVSIESVGIAPFNRLAIRGVVITDSLCTDTIISLRRLDAGVKLSSLLGKGALTIDYAAIIGAEFRLRRATHDSPLNARPLFEALKGNGKKRETGFTLAINTVVLRRSLFSYDVDSAAFLPGKFSPDHIRIRDLSADISLREIGLPPGNINLRVQRIAFEERCGFVLKDLHFNMKADDNGIAVSDLSLELPRTKVEFNDISLKDIKFGELGDKVKNIPVSLSLKDGSSFISPSDFRQFCPQLASLTEFYPVDLSLNGVLSEKMDVRFAVDNLGSPIRLDIDASLKNILKKDSLEVRIANLETSFYPNNFRQLFKDLKIPDKVTAFPYVDLSLNGCYAPTGSNADFSLNLGKGSSVCGKAEIDGNPRNDCEIQADLQINSLDLSYLDDNLGPVSSDITADAKISGKRLTEANLNVSDADLTFRGYEYSTVEAKVSLQENFFDGEITLYDSNAKVLLTASGNIDGENIYADASAVVSGVNLYKLNLVNNSKIKDYELSLTSRGYFAGNNIDTANATLLVSGLNFISINPEDNPLNLNSLSLTMNGSSDIPSITLRSDFVDADITGTYSFRTIPAVVNDILAYPLPAIFNSPAVMPLDSRRNNFDVALTLKYDEQLIRFLNLPVSVIHPVDINGYLSQDNSSMRLNVNAPYLLQKNKLIENSNLSIGVDSLSHSLDLYLTTAVPTKDGLNNISLHSLGEHNRIDTDISWLIDRKNIFKGDISFSTAVMRDSADNNVLAAKIDINPSQLVFNDSVWTVAPAEINLSKDYYRIENLEVSRSNQFITASGAVSRNPEDSVTLSVLNFNLDYLFETLGLDNVRLGGDATGVFYASNILTPEPRLLTNKLNVRNISFNKTVFGDAEIVSRWDTDKKGIMLDALITPPDADSLKTRIYGGIFPLNDSLDLHFNARRIDASFLLPYMSAFASSVSGRASGNARIYGNFKYIDFTGDLLAEDFTVGLSITNTSYTVRRDSLHITPGRIPLDRLTIYDSYGNTGLLNGYVAHKFFKDASFDITLNNADGLLCFNTNNDINPVWNGRIFADGTLFLKGDPGVVNINADLRTTAGSYFNLTLSDEEDAGEFHFITFRDMTPDSVRTGHSNDNDSIPDLIRKIRNRMNAVNPSSKSAYNLDLKVDITPDASITLLMNPQTPDNIRARGEGNMRLVYTSEGITAPDGTSDRSEDMKIYGKYEATKGNYYFTLQDIIVKDFIIKPGSSITFTGNPDAAQLDLSAYYLVNANLSDLDESFSSDKDLNRTNVPVHALLNVDGDIRQPEISFNIEFPTLNSDIDRKVRSIISTDEMMSTQIIYLLALNRFYTPEYMASTTKGNEFVSVASSTLSSRLASMLGSLSDNWTLAPNVRSDKGDFSDVEVDLALSSSLLNNRLLFNGNLGYRDNVMNTNRFVGDFDIEYLLNKTGNIRLKAYNRNNDQNFYLKTAPTTQGVGIMYKIDFDRILKRKKLIIPNPQQPDSVNKKKIIIR